MHRANINFKSILDSALCFIISQIHVPITIQHYGQLHGIMQVRIILRELQTKLNLHKMKAPKRGLFIN